MNDQPMPDKDPVRVTEEMLKQQVAGQYFFNLGADALPADVPAWQREALGLLTLCILVLQNGWTMVGKSACVSPEVFDAEEGKRLALADAMDQMWALEGYVLKTFLHMQKFGDTEGEAPQSFEAAGITKV